MASVLIGAGGAVVGTFIAQILGVATTRGVDWIEIALQVGVAAAGISLLSGGKSRRRVGRR